MTVRQGREPCAAAARVKRQPLLNVGADGTVEIPEEEAESFLRAGWVRVDASDASAQQSSDPQTARPEPLSVMAKRLGILGPL